MPKQHETVNLRNNLRGSMRVARKFKTKHIKRDYGRSVATAVTHVRKYGSSHDTDHY